MLPGNLDGLGVLTTLRTAGVRTPVLILSALSAVDERIRGLKAGGDDYLTKTLRGSRTHGEDRCSRPPAVRRRPANLAEGG